MSEQVTFPRTSITVTQDGIQIVMAFSPDIAFVKTIAEADMNELCRQWLQTRRQVKAQQLLVADVMRTKRVD